MAPDTNAWAHLGALGAYSPLSAPRARVCNDYAELAPDAPIAPTAYELIHDWTACHNRTPRRVRGGVERLGDGERTPVCNRDFNQNKDAR